LQLFLPFQSHAAGVTIITHGFELEDSYPPWVTAMADAIPTYFQASFPGLDNTFTTYKLTITNIHGSLYYLYPPSRTNGSPPSATESGEIIIELDWSSLSADLSHSNTSTYDVADFVTQVLLDTNSFPELNGHPAIELPIHLVGHSRGGSLMSQISYDLGTNGIWTDQLTTLDPYPLNNDGNVDYLFTSIIDAPAEYTYSTVLFADNYWQDLGVGAPLDPDGESVNGAYVRQLTDLSGGYNDTAILGCYHSNVHLWYHGTIDLASPANDGVGGASITTDERTNWWVAYEQEGTNAGFYYSLIGAGNRMSTDEPVGPGFSAIVDGYNQFWDFGAGTSSNRTALPSNNGTWPNIIKFDVTGTNVVMEGDYVSTTLYYQYAGASNLTLSLYFDVDLNPYNSNSIPVFQLQPLPTGAGSISWYDNDLDLSTTSIPPGVYAIYGEISDGLHSRFLYAPQAVQILSNRQPQTARITLHANPANGGIVNGGGIYPVGSQQQISATPNGGWTFTGWSDGSTQTLRTVTVPSGGATYTADFTPPQPVSHVRTLTGNTLTMIWSAEPGSIYQLQYNADLSTTNWMNLWNPITATGATLNTTDFVTNGPQRFYRLLLSP
jgi:hypothetical protein